MSKEKADRCLLCGKELKKGDGMKIYVRRLPDGKVEVYCLECGMKKQQERKYGV